ncbi:zinc finger protein 497-like [Chanos chanos]|uniref:Zinc finger protein 497-like n=1 Tax=Chanos chanos TaxID=29144 RepID=A0A6J2WUZ7_CHACN|nr:zinc finger protein 497-like [Chanos chanos]
MQLSTGFAPSAPATSLAKSTSIQPMRVHKECEHVKNVKLQSSADSDVSQDDPPQPRPPPEPPLDASPQEIQPTVPQNPSRTQPNSSQTELSSLQNQEDRSRTKNLTVNLKRTLPTAQSLKLRQVPSAPLIRYQCGECKALFVSLSLWQRHSKLGLCSTTGIEDKSDEEKVEDVKSEVQTCLCIQCGSSFNSEEALATHRSSHHGLKGALHRCPICTQEFMNTTQFLYHRRQHRQKGEEAVPTHSANPMPGSLRQRTTEGERWNLTTKDGSSEEDGGSSAPGMHIATPTATPTELTPLPQKSSSSAPEPCPVCGQLFKRRCHLRAHLQRHSGQKPHRCPLCPKTFAYKSNLGRHRLVHGANRPYSCQRCGKGFTQSGSLKQHMLLHARNDANQQHTEREEEEEGEEQEEGKGGKKGEEEKGKEEKALLSFSSTDCSNTYCSHSKLLEHRSVHTGQFSCSVCGQYFPRKRSLQLHVLSHQGKQPLTCPHCSDQYLNRSQLDAHLPRCAGGAGLCTEEGMGLPGRGFGGRAGRVGRLSCDLCGHRCVTQEGLDLHRMSHSGQTPLRCPLLPCRRRFVTDAALQDHLLTHCPSPSESGSVDTMVKPRPYHCQHCGKDFTTASSLNVHLRVHTGERPFQCGQCGKCFRQIPHLRDHERLHSGERPFVCSVCGRGFVLAARLAEHARTHSGDKPYQCSQCHRAFRSLSNLGKHRKTHSRPGNIPPDALGAIEGQDGGGALSKGDGGTTVHTIFLVQPQQALPPVDTAPSSITTVPSPAPLVLLQPVVTVSDEQQGTVMHHAIEVIVSETGD